MNEYEIYDIRVKAFLAINKYNGISKFIRPQDIFRHIYGIDGESHRIIIITDKGIFSLPILERRDVFYAQREKYPEAIIVYDNDGKPSYKLTELRIYRPSIINYIFKIAIGQNNNNLLIEIPSQFLNNELIQNLSIPKIEWRSKPYNLEECYPYASIIKFGHEMRRKTICEYDNFENSNENYRLFQLILFDLEPQTSVSYTLFGPNEKEKIDQRDFDRKLFLKDLKELKIKEDEIKIRSKEILEKVVEKIFKISCKPADFGVYQISYNYKEEEIKFIDIASGLDCINPNLNRNTLIKALKRLLFQTSEELKESLIRFEETAIGYDNSVSEKINFFRRIVEKELGKIFGKYYKDVYEIAKSYDPYDFPSRCVESAYRYLEKYKIVSN
ncbi:MAG: hypothetical protein QW197_01830 [Candidatus Aenigmatarchaeota archaeon]